MSDLLLPAALAEQYFALPFAALAAVLLDRCLGEVRRWHPLVGFGRVVNWVEGWANRRSLISGVAAWCWVVLPGVVLLFVVRHEASFGLRWALDVVVLYFCLGARSLSEHAEAIALPLQAGDLPLARQKVGWIVSRETAALDTAGVACAAVESVLENGNDAVFGALFWFAVAGAPGALLYRLANTLDAMWGYRNARFNAFGCCAARIDDALNWLPARLTALSYALLGQTRQALRCWRTQAARWESPNAGPVMAAGAGSLGLCCGGAAVYHGRTEMRPTLGCGAAPGAADVLRASRLVGQTLGLWLLSIFVLSALLCAVQGVWRA